MRHIIAAALALTGALVFSLATALPASAANYPQTCGSASPGGGPAACSGTGVPTLACNPGWTYAQLDGAPPTVWVCTAANTWTTTSGGGGGSQVYPVVSRVAFAATSLTQNAYTTVASPSVTLGTSTGATAAWNVTVTFVATQNTPPVVDGGACIIGASAGTGGAGSVYIPSATCLASPANALAGATDVADLGVGSGIYFPVTYAAQYANGATVAFTCQIRTREAATTGSGACIVIAEPI